MLSTYSSRHVSGWIRILVTCESVDVSRDAKLANKQTALYSNFITKSWQVGLRDAHVPQRWYYDRQKSCCAFLCLCCASKSDFHAVSWVWWCGMQACKTNCAHCFLHPPASVYGFYGFVIGTMPNMLDLYRFVGSPSLRGEGTWGNYIIKTNNDGWMAIGHSCHK